MKEKNVKKESEIQEIPVQVKLNPETRAKLIKIAEKNGLSLNKVATWAISFGLDIVEPKLADLNKAA